MATLYDRLGVSTHATDDEIKRAYRKAAMKWHPDRNSGAEEVARATFQEIKDAYAILSDAAQRKVYDSVYAEQMRGWETQRARQQRAQADREAAVRAADEAAYAEMVSLAMRFADQGHNRDVLFGVLLGRRCEPRRAAQIADSVAALQAARREAEARTVEKAEVEVGGADERAAGDVRAGQAQKQKQTQERTQTRSAKRAASAHEASSNHAGNSPAGKHPEPGAEAPAPGGLGGLWFQFLNGLRF